MSLSQEQMIELMALADGELEGDAKGKAEALAESSDEARQALRSLASPARAGALREAMDAREARANAADIASEVMQRLGVRGGWAPSALRRVQGASRRLRVVLASSGVIALAAGIALYLHGVRATSAGAALQGARAGAAPREALPTGPASNSAETALASGPDDAAADTADGHTTPVEVIVIYATHSDAGVWHDARLHGAELDRPPLSDFERLRMVDRRMLHLLPGRRGFEALANGHAVAVTWVTDAGTGADQPLQVHVDWTEAGPSIDSPGAGHSLDMGSSPPADLTLKPGEPVVLEDEPSKTGAGAFFVELIARQ